MALTIPTLQLPACTLASELLCQVAQPSLAWPKGDRQQPGFLGQMQVCVDADAVHQERKMQSFDDNAWHLGLKLPSTNAYAG